MIVVATILDIKIKTGASELVVGECAILSKVGDSFVFKAKPCDQLYSTF